MTRPCVAVGSTAARLLAARGAQVTLFEARRLPRPKLCGGGLTPKAQRLVPREALEAVERRVDRVELRGPHFSPIDLVEPAATIAMSSAADSTLPSSRPRRGPASRSATTNRSASSLLSSPGRVGSVASQLEVRMRTPKFARRWAWVILPMLGVLALEGLQDTALQAVLPLPVHLLLLGIVLLGGALLVAAVLFRRFDRMTAELEARTELLEARNGATAALQRVSLVVSALRDLDPILDAVTEQARLLLGGEIALLCLAGDDGALAPRSRAGPAKAFHPGPDSCPHPDGLGGMCPLLTATVESDSSPTATAPLCRFVDAAYLGSSVAVPLRVGDRVLGTLVVSSNDARRFGALELATLDSLASIAAVAIDNARLNRRIRELGMVEERNRIARELHDGLAQVLAYVGTKSDAAISLLDGGRTDDARAQLIELGGAARSVYVDVREAILGLSTPLEPGQGVVPALREYAHRYAEAAKLPTQVIASPGAETARLAPAAEAQALRILQEALTNVRKHASARRVVVEASREDGTLVLEVRDDGRGFEPSAPSGGDWPHFGLAAMRERAASVGGSLEIMGGSGRGTIVRLHVPIDVAT